MLPVVPALQIATVVGEISAAGVLARCRSCDTERGLRLVGMLPFAAVWCPTCATATHYYAITAATVARLMTDEGQTWTGPMAEGFPAEALAQCPGVEDVLDSLSRLHRLDRPPAWCVGDWPSVQRPETRGELERITAMIDAFHTDTGTGFAPHVITTVPTTRRELGVLEHATFRPDPLPPDECAVRNIFIDLGARHRTLQHTFEAWTVRRTLTERSRGAATIMWATHWLTKPEIASHLRPDRADDLRWQTRRRNQQLAAAWPSDGIAKHGGPPDHPILLPVTVRELAALRAGTHTQPGPDTIGLFLDDWDRRAQATTSGEPEHLRDLIDQYSTGAAWATQGHRNAGLADNVG